MIRIVVEDTPIMLMPKYDVVISGAGPVGTSLALLLARRTPSPERIALVGPQFNQNQQAPGASGNDPRTLALNQGSQALLHQLGAWPDVSARITTVHVSQRGRLGRTLITPQEMGVDQLGSVVAYDTLLSSLHQAVARSGVSLVPGRHQRKEHADHLEFSDGTAQFTGRVCVQSDGERPQGITRLYNQHALLVTVRASQPRSGWAFERFTREGPLAVLPHPAGQNAYGVVWCCTADTIDHLRALDDKAFALALNQAFGSRLGHLMPEGERHVFPLQMHAGPSCLSPRTVAIGNAAQTLHPVAGQGLNLGLRDAAQLALALEPWLLNTDSPAQETLKEFARQRQADRWVTAAITDTLPRIFTTGHALVEHACGLALLGMDTLQPLRLPLAQHLLQGLRR